MQFHVPDMSCANCIRHIGAAIARLDQQAGVEADLATRTIGVTTDVSRDDVERVLADEGYPATPL